MSKIIDMTGKRFCRLLVISTAGKSKGGKIMWMCKCDCGEIKPIAGHHLRSGATKSCGCLDREKAIERFTTHGEAHKTREWQTWVNIRNRCYNKNNISYPNYGARGITVCDRWLESYENFLDDMGRCPGGCTIDRIDNDKGYSPSNCKWSTRAEQMRNTRRNVWVEFKGKRMVQKDFANLIGAKQNSLQAYLKTHTINEAAQYYGGEKCVSQM